VTGDQLLRSAAVPTKRSAFSLPRMPACPFTHWIRPVVECEEGADYLIDPQGLRLGGSSSGLLHSRYGASGVRVNDHVEVGILVPFYGGLDGTDLRIVCGLSGSEGSGSTGDDGPLPSLSVVTHHPRPAVLR